MLNLTMNVSHPVIYDHVFDMVQDHMVQEVYSSYGKSLLTSMTHQQLDSYYFVARTLHMEWIDLVE